MRKEEACREEMERELQSWAVELLRKGRRGRFADLKKKGFVN